MLLVEKDFAVKSDSPSIVSFEPNVVDKVVLLNLDTSTDLSKLFNSHGVSDVDCVSSQIGHVFPKGVVIDQNVGIGPVLPVRRVY